MRYVAFLRGINVGGNSLIKMAALREALSSDLQQVTTYIQSGNVLFEAETKDMHQLANIISRNIKRQFALSVDVAIFTAKEWQDIIKAAPAWWGKDATWKHNILIMIEPYNMDEVITAYGKPKPEIEALQPGAGILYQSLSFDKFGRTVGGKLASNPIYKKMTIRNFNTANKISTLLGT